MQENAIGTIAVESAIFVHKELGPGLLESVYETVLADELERRGLAVETQVEVPIRYRERHFDVGFRADIVANGTVILELRSVKTVTPVHKKQLQTYLHLTGAKLGYLLNFGDEVMKTGIKRAVNGLEER